MDIFTFFIAILSANYFLIGGNGGTGLLICLTFALCQYDASMDVGDMEKRIQAMEVKYRA